MPRILATALLVLAACNPPIDDDPTLEPIAPYDPLSYVDPFIATGGVAVQIASVSPGASVPFGMTLAGPDTRNSSYGAPSFYHCAGYHWEDDLIDGFSQTHAHGMGVQEYGGILVMPRATWMDAYVTDEGRSAPFRHEEEWASPGSYAVVLQDHEIRVDIAATQRGAVYRIRFQSGTERPTVVFDLGHTLGGDVDGSTIDVDLPAGTVKAYQRLLGSYSGRFGGLRTWASAAFDVLPVEAGTWTESSVPAPGVTSAASDRVGAWVVFPPSTETVELRIALSYVDADGADGNFAEELEGRTYDDVLAAARQAWTDELSTVRVRGGTEAQRRIFHTALYHSMLMPDLFLDADGRYRGLDDAIHDADFDYYTDFSLWDTFRTLHPWYILAKPERQADMLRSLEQMTRDGGYVPKWPLGHGYTGGMVGSPADQVFAESYLKGMTDGWDPEFAFDACLAHATGPVPVDGRDGIEGYLSRGWVAFEDAGGPASCTLELAWSDDALSRWAAALGRDAEAEALGTQSGNWRNTWDAEAGFFVGRHADGNFAEFEEGDESAWRLDYVEGDAWHYLWYVPYDVEGMVALQHGSDNEAFLERLEAYWDAVRAEPDDMLPDEFYWHGNEPVMHYAFLGSMAGAPDLTAEAARWVMSHRYTDGEAGLDGNDDSGTLSAWYLFASAGFFPIAGTTDYLLGSPLFSRVEIDRPDGSMLVVRAPGVAETSPYVHAASLGGVSLSEPHFSHSDLIAGRELVLRMGEEPVRQFQP